MMELLFIKVTVSFFIKIMCGLIASINVVSIILARRINPKDQRTIFIIDRITLCWCTIYWIANYDFNESVFTISMYEFAATIVPLFIGTIIALTKIK